MIIASRFATGRKISRSMECGSARLCLWFLITGRPFTSRYLVLRTTWHGSVHTATTQEHFGRKDTAIFRKRILGRSRTWNARTDDCRYRRGSLDIHPGIGERISATGNSRQPGQRRPTSNLHTDSVDGKLVFLELSSHQFSVEWMQNSEQDIEESREYLETLIREVRPDLLHFNQYC